jgi:hypothetical protein
MARFVRRNQNLDTLKYRTSLKVSCPFGIRRGRADKRNFQIRTYHRYSTLRFHLGTVRNYRTRHHRPRDRTAHNGMVSSWLCCLLDTNHNRRLYRTTNSRRRWRSSSSDRLGTRRKKHCSYTSRPQNRSLRRNWDRDNKSIESRRRVQGPRRAPHCQAARTLQLSRPSSVPTSMDSHFGSQQWSECSMPDSAELCASMPIAE